MNLTKDRPCLFCEWKEDLKQAQEKLKKKAEDIAIDDMSDLFPDTNKPWKSQFIMANEHFYAVLSKCSKIEGHTLVISREHFSSMVDRLLMKQRSEFKTAFFNIMTEMARRLAILTEDHEYPKIYFMSICEHWKPEELDVAGRPYHTEHLHFHLLPRLKTVRTPYPYYVPECIFTRCDKEVGGSKLEEVRRKILTIR